MSGTRELNSRLDLGKIVYYHYTSPAYACELRRAKPALHFCALHTEALAKVCRGADLHCRPQLFQSCALLPELPRLVILTVYFSIIHKSIIEKYVDDVGLEKLPEGIAASPLVALLLGVC